MVKDHRIHRFKKVGLKHNRDIARQAVRESMVLLKNNNNVLPLTKGKKILVVGADANSLKTQTGGWTLIGKEQIIVILISQDQFHF